MMSRIEALSIIDAERDYQDATFNPDELKAGGTLRREDRDKDVTPHLVMIDSYLRKAMDRWTLSRSELDYLESLRAIAKIGAIAARALERCGGSESLIRDGLRD